MGAFAAPFTVQMEVSQGVALVAPSGELDINTAPTLADHLRTVETQQVRSILLDLRELTFMDSMGLKVFIEAAKRSQSNGHRLSFVGVRPEVMRVFEVTGMKSVLDPEEGVGLLLQLGRDATSSAVADDAPPGQLTRGD